MRYSGIHMLVRAVLVCFVMVSVGGTVAIASTVVPQSREQITLSYAPLVEQTAPAVVNIYTQTIVEQRRVNPLFSDPFFQRFFGDEFSLQFGQPQARVQNSLGSGVIISHDGMIVTNNHVIEGADKIRVVLTDRREFEAKLVGVDERTDIAVLRIESGGKQLPFIEFGDSDGLLVGDLVLAIGNPFGVGQTVTSGIISGLARTHVGVADIGSFIQTDAAINPGNSGGALVTMDGRLAGINTAIFSNSGGSLGIGFAVPANMVRFVIDGMGTDGRVVRPWLGARGQAISSDIAESLGLDRPIGVLVNDLWPNAAAERSGIRRGDVILDVNGTPVNDPRELAFRFASLPVGDEAVLSVLRPEGQTIIHVELEPASKEPLAMATRIEGKNPLAGMTIANMSPALGEKIQLNHVVPGVIILSISRGTPASRLGFHPMDRLVSINGNDISEVDDVKKIVTEKEPHWDVNIDRDGKRLNLVVSQ